MKIYKIDKDFNHEFIGDINDMEFIYENEKIIVIAVNFEGVKKYGSSYWCIIQDEDTFDGYANDGESI